jgi:acyl dehydratase
MRLFADFAEGELLGSYREAIERELLDCWQAAFPDETSGAALSHGLLVAHVMRAYMRIMPERPPGNVHARQRYQFGRGLRHGETLVTEFHCAGRQLKGERRWVNLRSRALDASGECLCRGEMSMLWAA